MGKIRISGNACLNGTVTVQGSKNAVLPVMAAAVLHKGCSVLHNCPHISDVFYMEKMLKNLGAVTKWEGHTLILDCSGICEAAVEEDLSGRMRSSVMLMGGMLGRCKKVRIGYPGGCVIGSRPIDFHLELFRHMGACISEEEHRLLLCCDHLRGITHCFPGPSVGATENGILAAIYADGPVCLRNCAREPEICYLCAFLRAAGAKITGDGTGQIRIEGNSRLHDTEFTIPSDRIAAGTLLLAGAITRGRIELLKAPTEDMGAVLSLYCKMGGQCSGSGGTLLADSKDVGRTVGEVTTAVYPGFPTDLQSPLMAVCNTLEGISGITETVFENRFRAAEQMKRMGADIILSGNHACIKGPVRLRGCRVKAQDLRGGAALVLAGLAAEGDTVVEYQEYIERGYESFYEEIGLLGGSIVKVDEGYGNKAGEYYQ